MSDKIEHINSLRIHIEPVEIELDEENALLWTCLQSAFPGCSGLYYKDQDSKCAVRFDGKKFTAPSGDWAKRTYYAAPGQRCLAPNHLGSYENATKQFEKSVLAVQKMLGVADVHMMTGKHRRERIPRVSSTPKGEEEEGGGEKMMEKMEKQVLLQTESYAREAGERRERRRLEQLPITAIGERQKLLENAERELTPIEQQFVDLARISTGKDAIIEKLREEIRNLHDDVKERDRELKEKELLCTDLESRKRALEEELDIFRNLSAENVHTGNQIAALSERLTEKDSQFEEYRKNVENEIMELKNNLNDTNRRNISQKEEIEGYKQKTTELEEEIVKLRQCKVESEELSKSSREEETKMLQREREEMSERLRQMESAYEEVNGLEAGMAKENTALREKVEEMEGRIKNYDETLSKLNEDWKGQFNEKQEEWSKTRNQFEAEIDGLRAQVAQQQKLLDEMTREATEAMKRAEKMEMSRNELLERANASEFKTQEGLKRQVRQLSEDLRFAEEKVAELTGLVASLATDAHSTRRDISDLL